ncbi:C39 family peptidase [Streptococcus canis]|uniref:M protein n=1 Tax=Streptococcus canis FSL Z3-227 TaxID=482234 RepID=A0AAV3FUB3_STRCB|nr:C39 family peptidase [Streptococcus canis]EIQ82692.1 M protein [Streptococcus canis FSL Z3-227]
MKKQLMAGIAIASMGLSSTVYAEEQVSPIEPNKPSEEQSDTTKKVTEADVKQSEAALVKSQKQVEQQESAVASAEKAKTEAELAVTNAELAVTEAETLANSSSPEMIEKHEAEVSRLTKEIDNANKELSTVDQDLLNKKDAIEEQNSIITTLKSDLALKEGELNIAAKDVIDTESLLNGYKENALRQELNTVNSDLRKANETLNKAEQDLERAKLEESKQNTALEVAATAVDEAELTLSEASQNLAEANKQVTTLQAVEDQLSVEIAETQETIKRLKHALAVSETDSLKELESKLEQLAKAQENVRLAEQALVAAHSEDKNRQRLIQELEAQVRSSRQELRQATIELERLSTDYFNTMPSSQVTGRPYYLQTDPRWINNYFGQYSFGASGCVPTALAMIYSELSGRSVMPLEVGNWLYNNTNEFNKRYYGTTGKGILIASSHYGYEATPLGNFNNVVNALKEGHIVTATVQQNKFAPWGDGTTHQIVLKGYSNGSTYVYDPYTKANEGWYSVQRLWAEQSTDAIDTAGVGAPFIKITLPGVEQLKERLDFAQTQKNRLEERVVQTSERLKELSSRVSSVRTRQLELEKARQLELESNKQVASARTSLSKAKEDKSVLQRSLQSSQDILISLTTRYKEANSKTQLAKQGQQQAQHDYNKHLNRLKVAKESLVSLKTQESPLKSAEMTLLKAKEVKKQLEEHKVNLEEQLTIVSQTKEEQKATLEKVKLKYHDAKLALAATQQLLDTALAKLRLLTNDKTNLENAIANMKQVLDKRTSTLLKVRQTLGQLENAPELLKEAETNLEKAKQILLDKVALLEKEEAILKTLQEEHASLAAQHEKIIKAYQDLLKAKQEAELLRQQKELDNAIPKVNSQGQVTGYMAQQGLKNKIRQTNLSSVNSTQSNVKPMTKQGLPKTGESSSFLVAIGSILSGFGLMDLKRRKK